MTKNYSGSHQEETNAFYFSNTVLTLCLSHSVTVPQGQETTVTRPSSLSLPPLPHLSSPGLPRAILGASTHITYLFALSLITDAGLAGGKGKESYGNGTSAPPANMC